MSAAEWVISKGEILRRRVGLLGAPASSEPSTALFRGIRWRLAVWYSGILSVALLLSGIVLYVGVRHSLLAPVDQVLQPNAQRLSQQWQAATALFPGLPPACANDRFAPPDYLFVCYDIQGHVLGEGNLVTNFPRLSNASLVTAALRNGHAVDTVDVGPPLGSVERYAVKVPAPDGRGTLGVILVATQVGAQVNALDSLLHLMLILAVLTILFSTIGGLFLANRALLPARLAHTRQQAFIADASHELRTPLTMLRSNVEVVLRGRKNLPPEDVTLLEDTVMEAAHLTSMANNMLDLARLDRESVHLEEEIVDLTQLSGEVARWAASLAAEQALQIHSEEAVPVLVVGDRSFLEQAILMLVDNAIKYNRPGGGVWIRTWLRGEHAHVEIRDSGIGIEALHLSRLGERFYRVDKARSRESGGAGLGLSLVRRIATRHGGSLALTNAPGEGTTATLSLPAAQPTHAGSAAGQD